MAVITSTVSGLWNVGAAGLWGTPFASFIVSSGGAYGHVSRGVMTDCLFGTPATSFVTSTDRPNPAWILYVVNKNADVTSQEIYTPMGLFQRDNSIIKRSKSAIKLTPMTTSVSGAAIFSIPFSAPNGVTQIVEGYLRKNASYGGSTLPRVEITGLGITPIVFTGTNSTDTWEKFSLSATNSSGSDGNLTLTFYGQTLNSGGICYMSGIIFPPFVSYVDHYDYLYKASELIRTVDPIITQATEATVVAYAGISIAGSTITVSSNHTLAEVYDYAQQYRVSNLVTQFLSSTDGINFTCSYNITVDGCILSGSGTINMPSNTLSVINGGSTVPIIVHNAGTRVNIKLTGIVSNSRVQLYDVTATTELYNSVVSGTTVSIPFTWTVDRVIRYRVMYVSGATAYKWVEATGSVTNTGMNIIIAQELDPIYNSIGIDGSTVTEASISGTTLVINIDDSDNITTAQRLLAFEIYWLSTVGGIRDQNLYIDYSDSTHLIFEGGLKIKNLDMSNPLSIVGASIVPASGNPGDVIDASGGSININTDRIYQADTANAWGALLTENTATGSFGAQFQKLLTTGKFIGLK